jgi:hypothetical protein
VNARDFIRIDATKPEAERKRLGALQGQLERESAETKRRLVGELLTILTNPEEALWPRFRSCTLIGAHAIAQDIQGSRSVVRNIRHVIDTEFVGAQSLCTRFLKKKVVLREVDPVRFSFLEALLLTLLRVDHKRTESFVLRVAQSVEEPEKRADLIRAITNEQQKLRRGC